jgi:hypothetical protein
VWSLAVEAAELIGDAALVPALLALEGRGWNASADLLDGALLACGGGKTANAAASVNA